MEFLKTLLMIAGGLIVGLAIFLILAYFGIRIWFRSKFKNLLGDLEKCVKGAFAAQCLPMRIELVPLDEDDDHWEGKKDIDEVTNTLTDLGFEFIGDYKTLLNAYVQIRAFTHPTECTYAVLYQLNMNAGWWVDFYTSYQDGTNCTYSTAWNPRSPEPSWATCNFFPGHPLRDLWELCLAERPDKEKVPTPPEGFTDTFVSSYARRMDWLAERGGYTPEEIRAMAVASNGNRDDLPGGDVEFTEESITDEQVAMVQQQWRQHFNEFFQEQFLEGFMKQSSLPPAEWEEVRDRLIFVYDKLTTEEIMDWFGGAVSKELELEFPDDEDEEYYDLWDERVEEWKASVEGLPALEAFARLNDRANEEFTFRPYGEMNHPFPAQVWLGQS